MPLFHLLLIAVIQGITEFLPISSSGHLILLTQMPGMDAQGIVLDVAVHVGTLFAVVLYFWSDVRSALAGTGRRLRGKIDTQGAWLALCLAIATVPVILCGIAIKLSGFDEALRSITVIGWTMLLFGLVLYWADQNSPATRETKDWSLKHAAIMGLWQAIALIPGTSRSGSTMTGGRFLGYTREEAARLSMLMSIPTIAASGLVLGVDVIGVSDWSLARDALIAAAFAFISALIALALKMHILKTVSFTPYVIYRVILGIILLVLAYGYGW